MAFRSKRTPSSPLRSPPIPSHPPTKPLLTTTTTPTPTNPSPAFYKRLFPHLPQKDASIHLTQLWKQDPFKAKWTIVAAAYSRIRDGVGRPGAPLDAFLDLICPAMGLVRAEDYFAAFNWVWEEEEEGRPGAARLTQRAAPDLRTFDAGILQTSMTEMDVIRWCGAVGYLPRALVGPLSQTGAQRGLLASAPALPPPPTREPGRGCDLFRASAGATEIHDEDGGPHLGWTGNVSGATEIHDDDGGPHLGWTGNLSELCHTPEAPLEFPLVLPDARSHLWDPTTLHDQHPLETFLDSGGMGGGFLTAFRKLRDGCWESRADEVSFGGGVECDELLQCRRRTYLIQDFIL
jgi:hypothetical protein